MSRLRIIIIIYYHSYYVFFLLGICDPHTIIIGVDRVIHELNVKYYEGNSVFGNEGLKVTFDRNMVSYSKLSKTDSGKLVIEKNSNRVAPAPVQVCLFNLSITIFYEEINWYE